MSVIPSPGPDADAPRRRAWERGRECGGSIEGWGGACPYPHEELPDRKAWFMGFSKGRASCPPVPRGDVVVPSVWRRWTKEG